MRKVLDPTSLVNFPRSMLNRSPSNPICWLVLTLTYSVSAAMRHCYHPSTVSPSMNITQSSVSLIICSLLWHSAATTIYKYYVSHPKTHSRTHDHPKDPIQTHYPSLPPMAFELHHFRIMRLITIHTPPIRQIALNIRLIDR